MIVLPQNVPPPAVVVIAGIAVGFAVTLAAGLMHPPTVCVAVKVPAPTL